MTKHGGTFKLSGETRELLRENQPFFQEVLDLYDPQDPEKIPLKFSSRDSHSRSEAKIQPGGDVEVSFLVSLDNDPDPDNGRIYLRDKFVFDPAEKKLKSYERSFENNGKGDAGWEAWLKKFQATLASHPRDINHPEVQKFAFSAGKAFGRPITDDKGATLPEFRAAFGREHRYLDSTHLMVAKNWQDLTYKIKDRLNNYTIARKEDQLDVTFHIAIDGDDDPSNGRLILSDTISFDLKTWEMKSFARSWEPAPEVAETEEWKSAAENMNQLWAKAEEAEKKQLGEEAEAFVRNMAPLLLTGVDMEPKESWNVLLASMKVETGTAEVSDLAKRFQKDPRRGEGTSQILESMHVLANESLSLKHDSQAGWWNSKILRRRPLDLNQAQKITGAIFAKALEAHKAQPQATAFEVLKSLSLEGEEAQARDHMLSDKLLTELNSIGSETDPELRAHDLLHFADQRLFRHSSMGASAQNILLSLKESPFVQAKASAVLATLEGKGSFGNKFEAFLPRFTEQVAHPASLIAMGGAPFLGAAAEGLGLAGLSRLGLAMGRTGRVNMGGRWLAGAFGLTGEAFAFTALHQAGMSAVHDPNKVMGHFGNEFVSGVMLFGAMRAAHAGVNPLTARWLSKNPTEAELLTAPTGRLLLNPRWGGGAPTRLGKVLTPVINHGSGITAMYAANTLARYTHLMPDNGQDQASHFLDSALSYGQAVVGFNLANRLSHGRLQGGLAETKLRLDSFGRELGQVPQNVKSRTVTNPPKSSGLTFKFNNTWSINTKGQKVIWIGSMPSRAPGPEYFDGYVKLNIGDVPTVSEYHAVLTRDQSDTFWYMADAGSTYGTFNNSRRLHPGEHVLTRNNNLIELGDGFPLRIEAEGNILKPDKRVETFVRLPATPVQKRLGPPEMAEIFPFEALYPGLDVSTGSVVEVAQLRSEKGEVTKLTSMRPSWGKADTALLYIDKRGRWVLQNFNTAAPIEVHRPSRDGKPEERWTLQRFDKNNATEEQKAAGRQDWAFLESGDRIGYGRQILEFVAHEKPVDEQSPETSRALGASDFPPPPDSGTGRKSVPPARDSVPPDEGFRDSMSDRETLVDIKPVPSEAYRPSDSSEITLAGPIKFTNNIERHEGFLPGDYLQNVPPSTPVFELQVGGRTIRADMQSSSYIIGREPDVAQPYQSAITIAGRLMERIHAEIFLAQNPHTKQWQWFLTDKDSSFGTYFNDNGKLEVGSKRESVPLVSGSRFTLGDPAKQGAVEFTFHLPWAESLGSAKPASVFPHELIRDLPADQPPMELVDNFGNLLFSADRKATRHIIGSKPESRESENSTTVTLLREKIDEEHCEIFVDDAGQYHLRSLTAEERTYVDGKEIVGGADILIPHNAEIALGGDPKSGHGITFIFKKADFAPPARRSSGPHEAADPEAIPLNDSELDSETPTVKPPPPRQGRPPLPPRRHTRPDTDSTFDPHATQVMHAGTAEELARRSMEASEVPPSPPQPARGSRPQGPHVVRRTNPPSNLGPPPAPPPKATKPEAEPAPAAPPIDEADFGAISAEVIDNAGPSAKKPSTGIPPPSSDAPKPVIPQASPVPQVELPAEPIPLPPLKPADPALTALHPDLRSQNLVDWIGRWIVTDKELLKKRVDEYKVFPRHVPKANGASTTETLPLFLNQVLRWESAARQAKNNQMVVFSEGIKSTFKELIDSKVGNEFGQVYEVSFDGQTLFYGSQGFENPNTSLTMKIKPGAEAEVLKGLHHEILSLDVPLKVTAPLSTSSEPKGPATYLGILYRAEDAAKVHEAVRRFAQNHPAATASGNLPFTHALMGANGRAVTGVGVMEYFVEGSTATPLDHRFRASVVPSFMQYATEAQKTGQYDQMTHLKAALQFYQNAGYDLANPGFRTGSLEGSHAPLRSELYFPE